MKVTKINGKNYRLFMQINFEIIYIYFYDYY